MKDPQNSSKQEPWENPRGSHDDQDIRDDLDIRDSPSSHPGIVLHPPEHIPDGVEFPIQEADIETILAATEEHEEVQFAALEVVFMSPEEITEINRTYLNHDYVTDIITFRLDDEEDRSALEGTLCCCDDRIREQSKELGVEVREEFLRVLIHGVLHLCGWEDDSDEKQQAMREREDFYLERIQKMG